MPYNPESPCSDYWKKTDWMPIEAILDYWCENIPQQHECKEAKKHAIIAACDNNEIAYMRSDGHDWPDPIYNLAAKQILLINRESFEAWSGQFSGKTSPLPPRGYTKREETLLKIIGGLLMANYNGKPAYMTGSKLNKTSVAEHIQQGLPNIEGLGTTTITEKITPALEAIKGNLRKW